jgi:hypothetical protein
MEKSSKEEESCIKTIAILKENRVLLVNKDARRPLYIGAPGVSRNNPIMLPLVGIFWRTIYVYAKWWIASKLWFDLWASSRFNTLKNGGSFVISTFTAENYWASYR